MIKQQISQKLFQKLTPQQIQLMRLLQLPTAGLEQRIKEELESNPALEEGNDDFKQDSDQDTDPMYETGDSTRESNDPFEMEDYFRDYIDDDPSSYKTQGDSYSGEDNSQTFPVAVENTFHEYLMRQLGMLDFENNEQRVVAEQIIGSIDDDGYLRRDIISIMDDLMFTQSIVTTKEEIEKVLYIVQKLEPAGVAARDLQESLALQLNAKIEAAKENGATKQDLDILELSYVVIKDHFEAFSKKHYEKLMKTLLIDEDKLKDIIDEIVKLNPKPITGFTGNDPGSNHYIVPDFFIENNDGVLELFLSNRNMPDLRISDQYKDMIQKYKLKQRKGLKLSVNEKETAMFIKQKIESAKGFIDIIQRRRETLYKTMYAIMQFQYEYFLTGDEKKLKPLILKDISEITGLDPSTISRVANSKYVQTEFGTRKLRSFFVEAVQTVEGEEITIREIGNTIIELIKDEDKKTPLSDEKLMEILNGKGYNLARRTIAKYRERLHIPIARLRKEI